ncbi:MAG: hypothetical protein KBF12_01580 [Sebaldella sp.]|nr:hypothetical protein [Sebaldella sp.]
MLKNFLIMVLGTFMLMSCQQNNSSTSKEEKKVNKKVAKKNVEVKFSFEDFTNTIPESQEISTGRGMKITFKNSSESVQEIMVSNIGINRVYSTFYASVLGNDKLDQSYNVGSLIVMGYDSTETLWLKTYKTNVQTGISLDTDIKFPAIITIPIKDLNSGETSNLEIVIDKDGKVLYEKVDLTPYINISERNMAD